MNYLKKLNENYFIYAVLAFVFIPINFIPQLYDSVIIDYAYDIGDLTFLDLWYKDRGREVALVFFYFVDFLVKFTSLPAEVFFDNLTILFLILYCIEVKKYSKFLFCLEKKWCNLAALFTSIFPVWHVLVGFDIGLYLISFYFLFFGYRNFVNKKKIRQIIGVVFIVWSFYIESSLSFVIGLAVIHLILNKKNNIGGISVLRFITIISITVAYYFIKNFYFPTSGIYANYNVITWDILIQNLTGQQLIKNIFNYTTYLLLYLWIPVIFVLNLIFINKKNISAIKLNLKKINFKYINNYSLLIILSGFAVFPYLLVNSAVPSILNLADYYQRHVFLLAPVSGIFFATMFKDIFKINFLPNKVNFNFYLTIFICIHLLLLNYGNLRKTEAYLFKKNLINELKAYGPIPMGDVQFIAKNFPASFRHVEVNHLLYKAYNTANWWGTFRWSSIEKISEPPSPPSIYVNDKRYSTLLILNNYKYECSTSIYIKNDLQKFERFKTFYVFNYKKSYKLDKIVKKC